MGADNPVVAIDADVDTLDLARLGFVNAEGGLTPGQPAFDPASLLKRYLDGYINRVHSSRRLARECRRNLEVMWLLEGLTPGYRTIAEFRKVKGRALRAACKDFVVLCKEFDLLGGEVVGIDGSFINASASDASVATKRGLEKALEQLEQDIDADCRRLDTQDTQEQQAPRGTRQRARPAPQDRAAQGPSGAHAGGDRAAAGERRDPALHHRPGCPLPEQRQTAHGRL
ncbi:MAG: transposase [Chromatiaceae bacterium]|nr:MAG: transposase [Chromatiaceae bacterium]